MTRATTSFLALSFALFLLAGAAFGQTGPDSVRQAAWARFKAQKGPGWEVRWNEKAQTPASIVGGTTRPYTGPPVTAARAFLSEHLSLFGMKPGLPDLTLKNERQLGKVHHVRFQQTYHGLPVYDTEYLVHLLTDGSVIMANGTYYPEIDAPTTPRVAEAAAEQIAVADLKSSELRGEIANRLLIYPKDGRFYLAWELDIPLAPFGGWFYYVDAESGAVLDRIDQLMDVNGTGQVYPTHPGLSSVTTKTLYRLDGSGFLRGTYVNVLNDESGTRAHSTPQSFSYITSDTRFDEVNLYYHI